MIEAPIPWPMAAMRALVMTATMNLGMWLGFAWGFELYFFDLLWTCPKARLGLHFFGAYLGCVSLNFTIFVEHVQNVWICPNRFQTVNNLTFPTHVALATEDYRYGYDGLSYDSYDTFGSYGKVGGNSSRGRFGLHQRWSTQLKCSKIKLKK